MYHIYTLQNGLRMASIICLRACLESLDHPSSWFRSPFTYLISIHSALRLAPSNSWEKAIEQTSVSVVCINTGWIVIHKMCTNTDHSCVCVCECLNSGYKHTERVCVSMCVLLMSVYQSKDFYVTRLAGHGVCESPHNDPHSLYSRARCHGSRCINSSRCGCIFLSEACVILKSRLSQLPKYDSIHPSPWSFKALKYDRVWSLDIRVVQ